MNPTGTAHTIPSATPRTTRWVDPPGRKPALNTNALDDVPDSTWFTNRIGQSHVAPPAAARATFRPPPSEPATSRCPSASPT